MWGNPTPKAALERHFSPIDKGLTPSYLSPISSAGPWGCFMSPAWQKPEKCCISRMLW
jgi:hypothetical protein